MRCSASRTASAGRDRWPIHPRGGAFGSRPWNPFPWLLELGYRFLFACPNGLVDYLPTEAEPFPPEYEMGYNVLAYSPAAHAERVDGAKQLRAGALTKLMPMAPPPRPNH